jgi:hypothetical protein
MKKNYSKSGFTARMFLFLVLHGFFFTAKAGLYPFSATYSGANEVPANGSAGTGAITGVYNDVTNTIFYTITFSGMGTNVTAAHFHAPAVAGVNAPVIIAHAGFPTGVTSGIYSKSDVLTDAQETQLFNGLVYSNIHTSAIPGGEIRAQIILDAASADVFSFSRTYSGANEVPANASPATGTIKGAYNSITNTIFYTITFSGLTANTTAAHFHSPAPPGTNAGVTIGHAGFPTGVTSGTFSKSDVLTNAQETNLLAGLFYSNIHTTILPGGEIRTQIFFDDPFAAPTITCPVFPAVIMETDPGKCTRLVTFAASVTGSPAPAVTYRIGNTVITSPYEFPVGTTTVTASALNGGGFATCTFAIVIQDLQGPTISDFNASPGMLWPPNHKMRDIELLYSATDNCGGLVNCQVIVTSDEPQSGTGNGDAAPDWLLSDGQLKLRAERAGSGDGRVYTIKITCTDQNGNSSFKTTTVTVPHDMSAIVNRNMVILKEDNPDGNTMVQVFPNPSRDNFTVNIRTGNAAEKISVRLFDAAGRVVEMKNNISGSRVLRIGNNLKAGIYIAEIRQGKSSRQLKLMKID